jgi:hypothetical protein
MEAVLVAARFPVELAVFRLVSTEEERNLSMALDRLATVERLEMV